MALAKRTERGRQREIDTGRGGIVAYRYRAIVVKTVFPAERRAKMRAVTVEPSRLNPCFRHLSPQRVESPEKLCRCRDLLLFREWHFWGRLRLAIEQVTICKGGRCFLRRFKCRSLMGLEWWIGTFFACIFAGITGTFLYFLTYFFIYLKLLNFFYFLLVHVCFFNQKEKFYFGALLQYFGNSFGMCLWKFGFVGLKKNVIFYSSKISACFY